MPGADNFYRYLDLRKEFPWFSYEAFGYHYTGESLEISFIFNLSDRFTFTPKITFPYRKDLFIPYEDLTADALDNLVFHIGMIEMVSYWKAACPPVVFVKPSGLSISQVEFWEKLYFNGLGEFFYMNSIPATRDDFMEIRPVDSRQASGFAIEGRSGSIVPVGGGKDSAVTMGLLNQAGHDWLPMAINPRGATRQVIEAAGKDESSHIVIEREIDPLLLELNGRGFLNGHTPFSALLAFYSLLAAYLTGRKEIILSNESSANEPTIPGTSINHQYSKSFEFEKDFRDYYPEFISRDFNYFSLLRPLHEIEIARIFSGMPGFFNGFNSCNVGSRTDSWCGACPKCLFTYIILSPFLDPSVLWEIFGKNLLDDLSLTKTLDELTGKLETKPFDCIGTIDEVNIALQVVAQQWNGKSLPGLLAYYVSKGSYDPAIKDSFFKLLSWRSPEHFVPDKYLPLISFRHS